MHSFIRLFVWRRHYREMKLLGFLTTREEMLELTGRVVKMTAAKLFQLECETAVNCSLEFIQRLHVKVSRQPTTDCFSHLQLFNTYKDQKWQISEIESWPSSALILHIRLQNECCKVGMINATEIVKLDSRLFLLPHRVGSNVSPIMNILWTWIRLSRSLSWQTARLFTVDARVFLWWP